MHRKVCTAKLPPIRPGNSISGRLVHVGGNADSNVYLFHFSWTLFVHNGSNGYVSNNLHMRLPTSVVGGYNITLSRRTMLEGGI